MTPIADQEHISNQLALCQRLVSDCMDRELAEHLHQRIDGLRQSLELLSFVRKRAANEQVRRLQVYPEARQVPPDMRAACQKTVYRTDRIREEHLASAERLIVLSERNVARQRERITELELHGHETQEARSLLIQFETAQRLLVEHRDNVERQRRPRGSRPEEQAQEAAAT